VQNGGKQRNNGGIILAGWEAGVDHRISSRNGKANAIRFAEAGVIALTRALAKEYGKAGFPLCTWSRHPG